ncbi:MAG: hypothetical protein M0Z66_11405 [Thermaerobacter sp.]|nr:hypothetical protein [Thermaerobacter sp.]
MSSSTEPKSGARMLLMLARTGFLVSFLLGLGGLFGFYLYGGAVLWIHIVFGLLFLVPAWMLPGTARRAGFVRAGAALGTLGAILAAVGALWAPGLPVALHIVCMIAAIALIEMGSGRAQRA